MPVSIRMHESGQYLIVTLVGRIADAELRRAYEGFYSGNDISIDLPELVELSDADLSGLTHIGLTAFSNWAKDFLKSRGAIARKSARLVSWEAGKSKLILHEVMMEGSPALTRTFSNREEAVRWLVDLSSDSAISEPTR